MKRGIPANKPLGAALSMSTQQSIYDLHIHTEFSPDCSTPLEAYSELAQQHSIHLGFLDHFELAFLNRKDYLNYDCLPNLFKSFKLARNKNLHISLGLEVDYYSDQSFSVAEFCDNYRKDFDYFIGTVHTIDGLAVTTQEELDLLITRIGLQSIISRYFDEVEGAIRSGLFDGIAHIDGVMRLIPLYSSSEELLNLWQNRTLELGKLCQKSGVLIEVNLSGLNHPWNQMHPSQSLIDELVETGAQFFVGSDSHTLQDFKKAIPHLKQLHKFLRERGALTLPISI